jgi:hypothetical protein
VNPIPVALGAGIGCGVGSIGCLGCMLCSKQEKNKKELYVSSIMPDTITGSDKEATDDPVNPS